MDKLLPFQEEILVSLSIATNMSLTGRVTFNGLYVKTSVEVKKKKNSTKKVKKAVKQLVALGYILRKPSGDMTYSLSRIGLNYLLNL